MSDKRLYKLNDDIVFRICDIDDCTSTDKHWGEHIKKCNPMMNLGCMHKGEVHLHCHDHRELELSFFDSGRGPKGYSLNCVVCSANPENTNTNLRHLSLSRISEFSQQAKALEKSELFKNAKLIRVDDYYVPELSAKSLATKTSKYWVSYDVKERQDGRALLVLYLGDREDKSKVQFFIEPETQKLSHDHSDTEPISVISRIEVEFKNGKIELKEK